MEAFASSATIDSLSLRTHLSRFLSKAPRGYAGRRGSAVEAATSPSPVRPAGEAPIFPRQGTRVVAGYSGAIRAIFQ